MEGIYSLLFLFLFLHNSTSHLHPINIYVLNFSHQPIRVAIATRSIGPDHTVLNRQIGEFKEIKPTLGEVGDHLIKSFKDVASYQSQPRSILFHFDERRFIPEFEPLLSNLNPSNPQSVADVFWYVYDTYYLVSFSVRPKSPPIKDVRFALDGQIIHPQAKP